MQTPDVPDKCEAREKKYFQYPIHLNKSTEIILSLYFWGTLWTPQLYPFYLSSSKFLQERDLLNKQNSVVLSVFTMEGVWWWVLS